MMSWAALVREHVPGHVGTPSAAASLASWRPLVRPLAATRQQGEEQLTRAVEVVDRVAVAKAQQVRVGDVAELAVRAVALGKSVAKAVGDDQPLAAVEPRSVASSLGGDVGAKALVETL